MHGVTIKYVMLTSVLMPFVLVWSGGSVHQAAAARAAGERLHHAHDHVQQARSRKAAEALEEELTACTFRPRVNHKHLNRETYVPLQQRAGQVLRTRAERIHKCVPVFAAGMPWSFGGAGGEPGYLPRT